MRNQRKESILIWLAEAWVHSDQPSLTNQPKSVQDCFYTGKWMVVSGDSCPEGLNKSLRKTSTKRAECECMCACVCVVWQHNCILGPEATPTESCPGKKSSTAGRVGDVSEGVASLQQRMFLVIEGGNLTLTM